MTTPSRIQTEDPAFVRDTHSKGLLCTNLGSLERHRRKLREAEERARIVQRFEALEERMDEVTNMMRTLLAKFE